MERLGGAKRPQRWKLFMKSLLCSICNVRSRKVPKWENMNRDILAKIFEKLNVVDITMGASRVCVSWFLVSHQKSLWKTINLDNLKQVDFNHPLLPIDYVYVKGLYNNPRTILIEITKLSSTVPTNLFFNFFSYIVDEDLIIAAQRMPNIGKLFLPRWCNLNENSYRFAFSQWKSLHTLIISPRFYFKKFLNFQVVGENCTNLTNLKLLGSVDEYLTKEIVLYLPKLKRLSMRCCIILNIEKVFSRLTCLRNLAILNLSHCVFKNLWIDPIGKVLEDSFIKTATQKIGTFITCSQIGCRLCVRDPFQPLEGLHSYDFYEKRWRNDEIKEFEF